jgi:hypothetical protein
VEVLEALSFLDAHPEIARINAHVQQKRGNIYAQDLDARVLAARPPREVGRDPTRGGKDGSG